MSVRLLVIALFASAMLVPLTLAYHAGLLHETDAGAELTPSLMDGTRVATLAWPAQALGLAASQGVVVWVQRGRTAGGLWSYDVGQRRERRLLPVEELGRAIGAPRMSGPHVVWAARGAGKAARIYEFDLDLRNVTSMSSRGMRPAVGGNTTAWIWHGPRADVIGVLDSLTSEQAHFTSTSRVRAVAVWGRWLAWAVGKPGHQKVRTFSISRPDQRYLLASDASALAMDSSRTVWAAARGGAKAALVAWDRRAGNSELLCVAPGPITSLTLGHGVLAWTRKTGDGMDVWAWDAGGGKPFPVSAGPGDQVSPVFVGRTLFWADDRSGSWELHARRL